MICAVIDGRCVLIREYHGALPLPEAGIDALQIDFMTHTSVCVRPLGSIATLENGPTGHCDSKKRGRAHRNHDHQRSNSEPKHAPLGLGRLLLTLENHFLAFGPR
jgi:hypothetical protein